MEGAYPGAASRVSLERPIREEKMSPGTEFPRNQWYVAAYGSEITDELLARTICGEPLVFWRDSAGRVVALADRCVHRRFPLSQSNRVGDTIVCGYHGF